MRLSRLVGLTVLLTAIVSMIVAGSFEGAWAEEEMIEGAPSAPESAGAGKYYEFSDILIPHELKLERQKSFIYETAAFTAGVLRFSGRVEVKSLTDFFTESMRTDNWTLAAKFTTPEVVLLFEKPNKRAFIIISETTFATNAQVWVAPFMGVLK